MKIIIITQQPTNLLCGLEEFLSRLTQEGNTEVSCQQYTSGGQRDTFGEIKSLQPDLLITVDLPGFEQSTLTDNIAYNLLTCKQLHLLLHRDLPNELYLDRPLNFAMFFYCVGDDYYDYLLKRYPELPYLKKLPGWQTGTDTQMGADRQVKEGNAQALYEAYREVLREGLLQP